MTEKLLDMKNITKRFGGVLALDNVDFDIYRGEIHCLVGENGSGKSTLIKIISGVHSPDQGGEMFFDGQRLAHQSSSNSVKQGIQVIYQDLSLFPNLTVAENICISSRIEEKSLLVNWKTLRDNAIKVMKKIGISLEPYRNLSELSIAERQLVAICRAINAQAKLVIMDEPTASLSKKEVKSLLEIIRELQKSGISILFVSHKLDEVMEVAQRVTVLRDGKKIAVHDSLELNNKKLSFLMTGKEFGYQKLTGSGEDEEETAVLEVRNLCRRDNYKSINLKVHSGEIVSITGLMGSGRTELALSLFGMTVPDSGEILLEGKKICPKNPGQAMKRGIAYVPEDRLSNGLVMDQSVGRNVILTILKKLLGKLRLINSRKERQEISRWVDELSIKIPSTESAVKTLSGGNQQRVVIAKWLAIKPKLLILDSPTVGIDIAAKDSIYRIIRELAGRGMAIIIITDEADEVIYHSNTVYIMSSGRIVGRYSSGELTERELYEKINVG
jgi:simple sugar transport system ATP-binding protein